MVLFGSIWPVYSDFWDSCFCGILQQRKNYTIDFYHFNFYLKLLKYHKIKFKKTELDDEVS